MALFVSYMGYDAYGNRQVPIRKEKEFHIGDTIPPDYDWDVVEVMADGHELDAIKCQMTNIPIGRKRVHRWFGDMAAFIAHNIRLVKEDT